MKSTCIINKEMYLELHKSFKQKSKISTFVGLVGLVAYIVISLVYESRLLQFLLWISAIIFGFGIIFWYGINKTIRQAEQNKITCETEFDETFMTVSNIKSGEVVGSSKTYYKDIVKVKETENYIFLYPNPQIVYPIYKKDLSTDEITLFKSWLDSAKKTK